MARMNVFDSNEKKTEKDPNQNQFAQFLINSGLYDEYTIKKENIYDMIDVIEGKVRINIYCKDCKAIRTFLMNGLVFPCQSVDNDTITKELGEQLRLYQRMQETSRVPRPQAKEPEQRWYWTNQEIQSYTRVMVFQYFCAYNNDHYADFVIRVDGNVAKKIGQFPSIADLEFPELNQYEKVLTEENRKEFGRAIGLYANGIGVGAYVYLRRIFERIIETTKTEAKKDGLELNGYETAHTVERIKMLQDYLPKTLVENAVFYSVVSKGIHELSEEDCITYFPILRECLFMILRQWEQQRQEKEAEKKFSTALSKIAQNIK